MITTRWTGIGRALDGLSAVGAASQRFRLLAGDHEEVERSRARMRRTRQILNLGEEENEPTDDTEKRS